jgi:DNA-binding response OmpR family regulator
MRARWHHSCIPLDGDDSSDAWRRCGLPKSVLIVDDEQLLVRTLSNVLRESGYRIATAGSAEDAERRAFADPSFDLIVLDNRLPGESGIEMIRRLREKAVTSKVILMTAYETPDVKTEAKRLKVDRYLRKPFDLTVLVDEVVGLIGPGGNAKG